MVLAVQRGLISLDEAIGRWNLSIDEFLEWQRRYQRSGEDGLRVYQKQGTDSGKCS